MEETRGKLHLLILQALGSCCIVSFRRAARLATPSAVSVLVENASAEAAIAITKAAPGLKLHEATCETNPPGAWLGLRCS